MISKPNNDDASTVAGSSARFSLTGLLLLSFGLLLSVFQPAFASSWKWYCTGPPGRKATGIPPNHKTRYSKSRAGLSIQCYYDRIAEQFRSRWINQ